jgi:four helix bundle protein
MDSETLKKRTKAFAVEIVKFFRELPKTEEGRIIGKQLLRSGTSIVANYRAVCRARSKTEFTAKMGIVVEESDETVFWLELLKETIVPNNIVVDRLLCEGNELLAIFAASLRTVKQSSRRQD